MTTTANTQPVTDCETTTSDEPGGGGETVTVTLRVDDVIELLDLVSLCHMLCVIAPDDINAAMAGFVVNDYNCYSLGVELKDLFRRIDQVLP